MALRKEAARPSSKMKKESCLSVAIVVSASRVTTLF
jgi:hypothetical protein